MADGYQIRLGPPLDRVGEIRAGESVIIGSGDGARIAFADTEPTHCRLEVTPRGLEVFNLSKGGTFVNGRRVERSLLKEGDELKLGPSANLKVWVRAPGQPEMQSTAERFTAMGAPGSQQKTQAFSKEALLAAAAGALPPPPLKTQAFSKESLQAAAAAAEAAARAEKAAPAPPAFERPLPAPPVAPPAFEVPKPAPAPSKGATPAGSTSQPTPSPFFGKTAASPAGQNVAMTVSPGGAAGFSPKPPPALTRKFDPEAIKAAQAAAGLKTAEATAKSLAETTKPAFRMSAAEEQAAQPKYKERDGSALLGTANTSAPVELSRRALFSKKTTDADEKNFQPAPEFQPQADESGAAALANISSKTLTLDPSLKSETAEERVIRSELEGSGLDVQARLGGTASTVVYRARRRDLGQEVVAKAVRVQAGDAQNRSARLLSEAKVAAKLHHPGIVQVHGVFRGRNFVAIVLESLRGASLQDEVAARGALTPREALVLGDRLARALIHAHAQGVVHRDVAPRNIMLTEQGELKLLGFGFATTGELAAGAVLPAGETPGTPGFAAPEQVANPAIADKRVDVYGLGATLYFALSGKAPEPQPAGAGAPEVVPISQVAQNVPSPLARVVQRALRQAPAERFDSCESLLAALRDASSSVSETGSFRKKGGMTALIQAASLETEAPSTTPKQFGFQGRLVGREIVGMLRLIEAGKKTGWLEVNGAAPDGSQVTGAIHFRTGEFVRAAVQGRRSVIDALVEIALLPAVDFNCVFGELEQLGPTEERSPVGLTLQAVAERLRQPG